MIIEATTKEDLISKLNKRFNNTEWEFCDFDDTYISVLDHSDNESVNHYSYSYKDGNFVLKHEF